MKLFYLILLQLISTCLLAQEYREIEDPDSRASMEEYIQHRIDFLKTLSFERAADLGSGNLELALKIANEFPDRQFYFEDIDPTLCNRDSMFRQIEKFGLKEVDTSRITIVIGDTVNTRLPEKYFDLVLMSGLIHEINDKPAFLNEVKRILKKEGSVVISDACYFEPPGKHKDCSNPFLTVEELDRVVDENNLTVIKEWRIVDLEDGYGRIFCSRILQCGFD